MTGITSDLAKKSGNHQQDNIAGPHGRPENPNNPNNSFCVEQIKHRYVVCIKSLNHLESKIYQTSLKCTLAETIEVTFSPF